MATRNGGAGVAGVRLTKTFTVVAPVNAAIAACVVSRYSSRLRRVARPALALAAVHTTSTYSRGMCRTRACRTGIAA